MEIHGMCVQARHEECAVCGAGCEQPCHGTRAHPATCDGAVHLCRVCRAAKHGAITYADAASVMHGPVFAGWSLVFDTAVAS